MAEGGALACHRDRRRWGLSAGASLWLDRINQVRGPRRRQHNASLIFPYSRRRQSQRLRRVRVTAIVAARESARSPLYL